MARFGITKMTNTVQFRRVGTCIGGCKKLLHGNAKQSKVAEFGDGDHHIGRLQKGTDEDHDYDDKESSSSSSSWWVPHYRTGIYYPRGQEGVMDDVPDGAASLQGTTYWFRNVEGVDVINME